MAFKLELISSMDFLFLLDDLHHYSSFAHAKWLWEGAHTFLSADFAKCLHFLHYYGHQSHSSVQNSLL